MPRNRRFATVEKSYITDIERERCKKVAAAYAELYGKADKKSGQQRNQAYSKQIQTGK